MEEERKVESAGRNWRELGNPKPTAVEIPVAVEIGVEGEP